MLLDARPTAPHEREPQPGGGGVGNVFLLGQNDLRRLTWEHLETVRLRKLGIPNRYSRHLQREVKVRSPCPRSASPQRPGPADKSTTTTTMMNLAPSDKKKSSTSNSLAPFYTMAKPTCGYFFSRDTNNKKRKFGIPASDLVQWRSFTQ